MLFSRKKDIHEKGVHLTNDYELIHMIDNHLLQKRFSMLTTLIVACCLLFTGMRVPDLTRPHRPKPSQRAVIESQVKAPQHSVSNAIDFFAIPVKLPPLKSALLYRTELVYTFYSPAVPTLFPNSSRAPPTILS